MKSVPWRPKPCPGEKPSYHIDSETPPFQSSQCCATLPCRADLERFPGQFPVKANEILKDVSREEAELLDKLDLKRLPKHVAVIMDGNGRWAERRHLPRVAGHRAGVKTARESIETCARLQSSVPDALRVLARKLAPAAGRSGFPHAVAARIPEARAAHDSQEQYTPAGDRAVRGSFPKACARISPTRCGRRRATRE